MIQMMNQGRSFSGHERNCCFLNVAGERFATVSAVSGLDYPDDGRAIAVVDWDQDGDLDLWISNRSAPRLRFMRNESTRENHSLVLRLVGNGKSTNRDAIGARVEVFSQGLEGKRLVRTLRAGEGFLSQSSKLIHFGLGEMEQVEKIIVSWPGGDVETFTDLEVDRRYELEQGSGKARRLDAADRVLAIESSEQPGEKSSSAIRIPLVTLLPMPRQAVYSDFDGSKQWLRFGSSGKPTLIVLWASWCAPCRKELSDLVSRENEIQSAGIDVVVLAVDGLSDDGTEPLKTACIQYTILNFQCEQIASLASKSKRTRHILNSDCVLMKDGRDQIHDFRHFHPRKTGVCEKDDLRNAMRFHDLAKGANMPVSESKRQKKLAKKRAKDKRRHNEISGRKQALSSGLGKMLAASQGEILGCYRCDANEVVEFNGMIPVLLIRRGPDGLLALANFLVDFWCMGVKDCAYHLATPGSINDLKQQMDERMGLTVIEPSVGRAMVELGVGFADSLGIAPHPDYEIGKFLWGDIPLGKLPDDIEFGVNGKPFYLVGPFDDGYRQRDILNLLCTSVGEGNFDFAVSQNIVEGTSRYLN